MVAISIGMAHRRPRAFFPVTLRWSCLTACLILPVWIVFSIADAIPPAILGSAANQLRVGGAEMRTAAKTPEQIREAEKVIETSEALERLASALDAAKERGIEVPRKDLTALGFAPEVVAELHPATKDILEQGAGLMALQQEGLPPPPGFSDLMREFGLDNPLIQTALLGLAAATLGPLLGVSPALVQAVLQALLIDGGLTWDNLFEVTVALALSTTKAGNISATLFKRNIKNVRLGREVMTKLHERLTSRGVSPDGEGMRTLRDAGSGASSTRRTPACEQAIAAVGATQTDRASFRPKLQRACPELTPQEIDDILGVRP
ncbi:hypothetical protein [Nannocystis sp.]|uniref:hypothetical protein n=1 Tax=Nannocystis sp. TaxID=1962667 RepID=UPI0025EC0949|nr:hypothetical protein [Nannocystis sp.]MBK7825020.1 hypothetical protein [Nannocystis sp.]